MPEFGELVNGFTSLKTACVMQATDSVACILQLKEHQLLVDRLMGRHLRSIQSLLELGVTFSDDQIRLLREQREQSELFLTSQKTLSEARAQLHLCILSYCLCYYFSILDLSYVL